MLSTLTLYLPLLDYLCSNATRHRLDRVPAGGFSWCSISEGLIWCLVDRPEAK